MVRKKEKEDKSEDPGNRVAEIIKNINKIGEKKYGAIMTMEGNGVVDIPVRSSGVMSLDRILGGGYPYGRIIEVYGPEASGKTTLTLQAIASVQRLGGACMFIDAEHALDPSYAARLGVDVPNLMINQPNSGELALDLVIDLVPLMKSGDMIVVDSVAALTPEAELKGEMGDTHMGSQARLMSQAMRKLAGITSKHGVIVFFVNQVRQKIGVMFGSPETTSGGNALKFYATVRLEIRRIGSIKVAGEEAPVGNKVRIKTVKHKMFPPFKEVETEIRFGEGIPRALDALNEGVRIGLVEKSGSWHSFKENKLGNGFEKALEFLKQNPEVVSDLENSIFDVLYGKAE